MKWRATRVIYRPSWLTGESGAAFSRPMSQHRRGDASSVWLMERDLRRPGGWEERGLLGALLLMGIVEYAPVERGIGSLFIEILEELGSVWPAQVLSLVDLLSSSGLSEIEEISRDFYRLTKFKRCSRNL